jgi:hypothetical protein
LDAIPDKQFRGKIKAMSGTAASDVFSGDPSKKFDVIFSIDMRQLLTGVGMKPADVERIMATAEANSKKNVVNTAPSFFSNLQNGLNGAPGAPGMPGAAGLPGMPGAAGAQGGMPGLQGGDDQDQGGGRQRGGNRGGGGGNRGGGQAGDAAAAGGRGGDQAQGGRGQGGGRFANMSDEDRQKMRDLRQKMAAASPEDQQKLQKELQDLMAKAGIAPGGGRGPGGRGDGAGAPSGSGAAGGPGGDGRGAGGFGGGGRGGMSIANPLDMLQRTNRSPFTEEERKNAKLPLPPEEDSQVQALLRPGLLADVEIVVEKIPNALHVPTQAVFDKGGKPTVFVLQKNGRFEARTVQLMKQSESLMVLSSGVNPGEVIALSDPTADKKSKSADKKSSGGAGAMGGMPGGK